MATRITATELDRELSDILNRVAYRGESFIVERGGKEVARIEPVGPRRGITFQELADALGHLRIPEGLGDDLEEIQASQPMMELIERPG